MTKTNDGGPAFPTENEHQSGHHTYHYSGMTLLDWFAGHASEYDIEHHRIAIVKADPTANPSREYCKFAYADAMLKAREATDAK